MNKWLRLLISIGFSFVTHLNISLAQDTTQIYTINTSQIHLVETRLGERFIGPITYEDFSIVRIRINENEESITVRKDEIINRRVISTDELDELGFVKPNPHAFHYLFAQSGFPLKNSDGFYKNTMGFFNEINLGITENFMVGGGILPLFIFKAPTPVWAKAKYSISLHDNIYVNLNNITIYVAGSEKYGLNSIFSGGATFGSADHNISVNAGYALSESDYVKSPFYNFSGMVRTGEKFYLITENHYATIDNEKLLLLSLAGRWIIGERSSIDGGLVSPQFPGSEPIYFAFPWIGITVPFGD